MSIILIKPRFVTDVPVSPVPEEHVEPQTVLGFGYGESKWVAETLLKRASEATGIETIVVRVGQLSGDSVNGGWTTKEWFPALIRSSQSVGCIPIRTEVSFDGSTSVYRCSY
jgi:thioester reductase-like protein